MTKKILIVSSNYYKDVGKNLETGAINTLEENNFEYKKIHAPGFAQLLIRASCG